MNIMNDEYLQKRLERAARCLKVLAHPIRLMIIHLLGEGELSVQELEKGGGYQPIQRVPALRPA